MSAPKPLPADQVANSPERKSRRAFIGTVVAIVSMSGCILVTEVILRAFFPFHTADIASAYRYDEKLGVRLRENLQLTRSTDHHQELHTNPLGTVNLRDDFTAYRKLVFAIGDSNTQGTGVSLDAAYPFQLDLMLNLGPGGYDFGYAVVNLGLAAYGTHQARLAAESFTRTLRGPDYVLYLASPNDREDDRLFEAGYRHQHFVQGNPDAWLPIGLIQCLAQTELGQRMKYVLGRLRRSRHLRVPAGDDTGVPAANKSFLNTAELDRLVAFTRRHHSRLIVSWAGIDPGYDWLKNWSRTNKVDFADWRPAVVAVRSALPGLGTHNPHSGSHFRPWVQQLVARSFADRIHASEGVR